VNDSAAISTDPRPSADPKGDATPGTTIPFHAPGPVARLHEAIERGGVAVPSDTGRALLQSTATMVGAALGDMEGSVSHVDWLVGPNPDEPLHGSWTITWSQDSETTVAIDHDGDATAMDSTGARWHRVGSSGLRLVTVRHVRRTIGRAVSSLSAVVDLPRLAMPEDEPDGRRPVHVARTIASLILLSATSLLDAADRHANHDSEPSGMIPEGDASASSALASDLELAHAVGIATLLDAGREDLLALPRHAPSAAVRLRRPSPLAPGHCIVGEHGSEGVAYANPDILPPQPMRLDGRMQIDEESGVSYVVASISTPDISDDLGGHDAIHNMRLARLAAPWRTRPETNR